MYYIFIENNKISGIGQCPCLNQDIRNIEVTKEVYDGYAEDNDRYIWDGEQIVENPDYETIKNEQKINEQKHHLEGLLEQLDKKRIRAICENEIKDSQTGQTWLEYYNQQVIEVRSQLNSLT